MGKKFIVALALGTLFLLQSTASMASVINFDINQSFSQGGVADLPATTLSLGGAGDFILDPGSSGNYFDFKRPGGGTFATIDTQISEYYFLDSYAEGEVIGAGNFGNHESSVDDWDTILVGGLTAGVWGSSHDGYLGFLTAGNLYGWIEYSFFRSGSTSKIVFLSGAYEDVAGADIIAGGASVPEPATMLLFGLGLIGLTGINRKKH